LFCQELIPRTLILHSYQPSLVLFLKGVLNEQDDCIGCFPSAVISASIGRNDEVHRGEYAKTSTMMQTMQDGPGKMAMGKEMGMANMEMSKGNMRGACMHYMNAQKMGAAKSSPGGMKM
jgi:hypothetical protein